MAVAFESITNEHLVVFHDAGFFSCCSIRLDSILRHYRQCGTLPVIINSSNQWTHYKTNNFKEDVTLKYFKEAVVPKDHHPNLPRFPGPGFCSNSWRTDYRNLDHENLRFFLNTYFTVSSDVAFKMNELLRKYEIDVSNTIAVLFRGNDKVIEIPPPSFEELECKIAYVRSQYPHHRLLLHSDELDFYEYFKDRFENTVTLKEEVFTIKKCTTKCMQLAIPKDKREYYAQNFLALILLMSRCNQVILNASNIGFWVALYRGHSSGMYEFIKNTWYETPKDEKAAY